MKLTTVQRERLLNEAFNELVPVERRQQALVDVARDVASTPAMRRGALIEARRIGES